MGQDRFSLAVNCDGDGIKIGDTELHGWRQYVVLVLMAPTFAALLIVYVLALPAWGVAWLIRPRARPTAAELLADEPRPEASSQEAVDG